MTNNEKNDLPLVTVIIPTRNRQELLVRAVRSVQSQTHKSVEIVIADDASTDGTYEVVRKLMASDPRIHYIRREVNVGAAAIRNVAFGTSRGRYVCFLDDDDEWLPEKIAKQLPFADKYSIVGCRTRIAEGFSMAGFSVKPYKQKIESDRLIEIELNDIFFNNGRLSPSSVMVTAERLKQVGGFDESLLSSQGRDLFVRLVKTFGLAVLLDRVLVVHFQKHGLERITTTRKNLIGGWMELEKNRHLMSPALQTWRTFHLCVKEAELAPSLMMRLRWVGKSLLYLRPKFFFDSVKVFAAHFLLR